MCEFCPRSETEARCSICENSAEDRRQALRERSAKSALFLLAICTLFALCVLTAGLLNGK